MENKNRKLVKLWMVGALLLGLGALVFALTDFITDWLWFAETGYVSVFFTEMKTKILLGVPAFLVIALLTLIFLTFLKRSFLARGRFRLETDGAKKLRRVGIILSLVFGAAVSVAVVSSLWWQILQYLNATDFNITDPLYGKDLGFYIFKLEFLQALNGAALRVALALLISVAVYYMALISYAKPLPSDEADTHNYEIPAEDEESRGPAGRILEMFGKADRYGRSSGGKSLKDTGRAVMTVAGAQLSFVLMVIFALVGVHFLLMRYNLLYSGTGAAYGAGYTDINVTLNMYRVLIGLSALSALFSVIAIKKKSIKLGLVFPALMAIVLLGGSAAAGAVQNLVVSPDEINKESKYLQYNIDYTRMAYDLQDIAVKDFVPSSDLDLKGVLRNMGTFSNIRINDFEPANQFYNQTQSIRSYYKFNDVDVDRYYVNGEYTQVFLSAREIDQSRIEDQWLIRHLKYTHGYGITLSRVDRVTSSGQPDMLIDSIPPVSEVPEINVTRPEIYFGESTDGYIVTNTSEMEFDYPSGETNTYNTYEGAAGIKLNFWKRILFAIREQSLKLLVSTNINSDSRILINRNIAKRVETIAPFLSYDDDPYVVTEGGNIYWMVNAYTQSSYYPYSEPYSKFSDINYIRNSVKVVVDAYNGGVDFYICDESDPIINTLAKIYPGMFKTLDEMPEELRGHIQYPNAFFSIQAGAYEKYHMTDVEVFYQNEDMWDIAREYYGQEEVRMTPNYFIMKLPGEENVEFVSSIPYTPSGKSNMTGILIARSDGDNYGKLVLYRLPKDRIIYGPAQIEAQINQDVEISKEFALWNNSGSTYSRGNLYVFPVEGSLLYAEPIYLEASTGSLPEVKRVIMYYGDKLAYESTFAECLNSLFGPGAGDPLNTAYPIESGRLASQALEEAENAPPQPQDNPQEQPQSGGEASEKSYKALAEEAYQKAMEYLQKMKEYLDMITEEGNQ